MNLGQFKESIDGSGTMATIRIAAAKLPRGRETEVMAAIDDVIGLAYRAGQTEGPDMTPTVPAGHFLVAVKPAVSAVVDMDDGSSPQDEATDPE